jgi:hypothetical protein
MLFLKYLIVIQDGVMDDLMHAPQNRQRVPEKPLRLHDHPHPPLLEQQHRILQIPLPFHMV